MDSFGEFHEEQIDGKLYKVYHHQKYHPIPPTKNLNSSSESCDEHSPQPLFLCMNARFRSQLRSMGDNDEEVTFIQCDISPEYVNGTTSILNGESSLDYNHQVLPLSLCNNTKDDAHYNCTVCEIGKLGVDYYFCESCSLNFHKECVECPPKLKHPSHPEHSLQLYFSPNDEKIHWCSCCRIPAQTIAYHCTICEVIMHPTCAMKPIPLVTDESKMHDHPLSFFPRPLLCYVCGMLTTVSTYICLECDFSAHEKCMSFPRVIRISRHPHRISHTYALQAGEWFCGVCRERIDTDYGAYTCNICGDYAVHPACALRGDLSDGNDLEGLPEEDDITQDAHPFATISDGVILHFLHDHQLKMETSIPDDDNKICQACVLPLNQSNFFCCMECDFVIHGACANSPRRIQHPLHRHPLTLNSVSGYEGGLYCCNACARVCGGFNYGCHKGECTFDLDVRCASISEPFRYEGHEHPLFLALHPSEEPICQVCKTKRREQLNCIECDFIVCFKCATLPFKAVYKHDKHSLTVLWGEEMCDKDWCEVCERNLRDTETKLFYWCNVCCTTLHIACLFSEEPYLKHGQIYKFYGKEAQILQKGKVSRPLLCDSCKNPCQGKICKIDDYIACSIKCVGEIVTKDLLPSS